MGLQELWGACRTQMWHSAVCRPRPVRSGSGAACRAWGRARGRPSRSRSQSVESMLQALLAVLNSVAAGQAPVPWGPGVGGSCRKSTR